MNLDEAIKDLENSLAVLWQFYPQHRKDAVQLGIEAGKREKYNRENQPNLIFGLLPGETED